MQRFWLSILLILSLISGHAQSFNLDMGLGTDTKNQLFIYNWSGGGGYSFTDNDYIFGGVKLQSYRLVPRHEADTTDIWVTNSLLNFVIEGGGRYLVPLKKGDLNNENSTTIGFYPEAKFYFNPYVPRQINYYDTQGNAFSVKTDYGVQLAYGLGFGIYFMAPDGPVYFAITFEYSNLDAFKLLRHEDYKTDNLNIPTSQQFTLGISLFAW